MKKITKNNTHKLSEDNNWEDVECFLGDTLCNQTYQFTFVYKGDLDISIGRVSCGCTKPKLVVDKENNLTIVSGPIDMQGFPAHNKLGYKLIQKHIVITYPSNSAIPDTTLRIHAKAYKNQEELDLIKNKENETKKDR